MKENYELNFFLSPKEGKGGKQKQHPSQHQICHQNVRHQKFLKTSEVATLVGTNDLL